MQKLLHAVDVLCIDYYEACPRKNRANKWNGCHSRPDRAVLTASAEKNCWDFVHAFGISSLASGRGGPRYCGGQPSGCKNGLSAHMAVLHKVSSRARNSFAGCPVPSAFSRYASCAGCP
jgi:hypothetical protein